VIRQQMEETRNSLHDKLESLEEQVKHTVQEATETVATVKETVASVRDSVKESVDSVKGSVHDTVESVKDSLSVERQFRQHPWAMFAGAAVVGFVGGRLLSRLSEPARAERAFYHEPAPFRGSPVGGHGAASMPAGNGFTPGAAASAPQAGAAPHVPLNPPAAPKHTWLRSLLDQYHNEIEQIKSLAIGTVGGLVREMAISSAPPPLAERIKEVVDGLTAKVGGEPIPGPLFARDETSKSEQGASHAERHEAEMGRPMGAAQR